MQTVALWTAVAVAVCALRLGGASPVRPDIAAGPPLASAAGPPLASAARAPPAAATATSRPLQPAGRTPTPSSSTASSTSASDSTSSLADRTVTEAAGSSMQKREAMPSPSAALAVRLMRPCVHSQQKREASPVTGASLSINNPIRVLRNRLQLQMYRRWRNKVMENSAFLHSKGKRSVRAQLERYSQAPSDDRFDEDMKQLLLR